MGDAAANHIQLKVKDQQGSEVQFKIKKSTPLRKLMDAYCSRLGLQASQVRFMVDGSESRPTTRRTSSGSRTKISSTWRWSRREGRHNERHLGWLHPLCRSNAPARSSTCNLRSHHHVLRQVSGADGDRDCECSCVVRCCMCV